MLATKLIRDRLWATLVGALLAAGVSWPSFAGTGLAAINPDGSERHFITPHPEEGHHPDWESVR